MGKSRLLVFKLKDLLYIAFLALALIILIIVLVNVFSNKSDINQKNSISSELSYTPGVYTTQLLLNDTALNMEIVVDESAVKSISITNIDESVTALYPLIEPSIENIQKQLDNGVSLEKIELSSESKYTETLLLESIIQTLQTKQ